MYRDIHIPFEIDYTCVTAEYTLKSATSLIVENRATKPNGDLDYIKGSAKCRKDGEGRCGVKFSPFQPSGGKKGNYRILDTDYNTYSVVYSCS